MGVAASPHISRHPDILSPHRPADLLAHREAVNRHLASLDPGPAHDWRNSFWSLLWEHKEDFKDWVNAFAEWEVVQTLPRGPAAAGVCKIRDLRSLFSLHLTDQSKQQGLLYLVHEIGCDVLHPAHCHDANQLQQLGPRVCSGDSGLCALLETRSYHRTHRVCVSARTLDESRDRPTHS